MYIGETVRPAIEDEDRGTWMRGGQEGHEDRMLMQFIQRFSTICINREETTSTVVEKEKRVNKGEGNQLKKVFTSGEAGVTT